MALHALQQKSDQSRGVNPVDVAMMQRAIALAEKAAAIGEVPVGAVVYKIERGQAKIVAEAFNMREASSDPVGHAELLALSKAGKVIGEWRLNELSMAVTLEPCPMCAGAMVNARLGRLIYGTTDPKAGACETLYRIPCDARLNHRVEMIGGVLASKCKAQLQKFFQQRREANKAERSIRSA